MKKSGFTLAELLISLGITGVIAALMTTALVTLQPDQKKAIYLRNYDALTKAVKALAGNSKLFPVCQDNLNCQAHPLFNTATGIDGRFASFGAGDGKLCKGLSYMMNGQMLPQLNCESQPIAYSDGNWTPSFRTYRTEWLVSTLRELNGSSATYQSDVYFDLNGPEGPNCVYSDSCQNPDRFKFLVAADGTVIPADPVGQEYISKRKNWRKSRLSIAEDSTTKENLLASLRTFSLTPCSTEDNSSSEEPPSEDPPSCDNPYNKPRVHLSRIYGDCFDHYYELYGFIAPNDMYIDLYVYEVATDNPACVSKMGDGSTPIMTMKGVLKKGNYRIDQFQVVFADGYHPRDNVCTPLGLPIKKQEVYFTLNGRRQKDCIEDENYFYY